MEWTIKRFNELSTNELYHMYKLRTDVFVVEQESIYSDFDGKDFEAFHLQIVHEGELVGYLRMLDKGVSYSTYSIGRVVIAPSMRGTGLGERMMREAIRFIREHWQGDCITISAQLRLTKFYERVGFTVESEAYIEDQIPHIQMKLNMKNESI